MSYVKYALEKVAVMMPGSPALPRTLGASVKHYAPKIWRPVSNFMFGDPRGAAREIFSGRAFKPGGMIRDAYKPTGLVSAAMMFGFPAYDAYKMIRDDEGDKTRRIGALLGSTALSMGAYRPFGMVGSMVASNIGSSIGSNLAGAAQYGVNKLRGKDPLAGMAPPPTADPNAIRAARNTLMWKAD